MQVEWRDVSVSIAQKQILAACSGTLQSGQLIALMGPSGSGKSTLMSCLRQDIPHSGEVRFNGSRFSPGLRQLIGYAEQDDVVIPDLTVRQTLSFLAELRYGLRSPQAAAKVAQVLSKVRMEHRADRKVGTADSDSRISGGERKRLCIARELLAEPTLLLCDEPTSGLDSTMASQVVMILRDLCDSGTLTGLTAIHQPSSDIFVKFDQLVLLKEGQMLYFGPVSEAETLFKNHGLARHPSESTPEYLMNYLVFGIDEPGGMARETHACLIAHVEQRRKSFSGLGVARRLSKGIELPYDPPFHRQLLMLVSRHGRLSLIATTSKVTCVQFVALTLVPAFLWVGLGDTDADVFPRMAVMIWITGTWMFFPIFSCLGHFQEFRTVLEKELKLGCYSVNAMYVARTILLLPIEYLWPTVFTCGVFWITSVHADVKVYLQVQLLIYLSYIIFSGVGLCISASGMATGRASVLAMTCIVFFFGWAGIFRDMSQVPGWIRWVNNANCMMYVIQSLMHVVLPDGLEFQCGLTIKADIAYSSTNSGCIVNDEGLLVLPAHEARKRLGIDRDPTFCLAMMFCSAAIFRLLAFALIHYNLWSTIHGAAEHRLTARNHGDGVKDPSNFGEDEDATAGMEGSLVNPSISDNVATTGTKDVASELSGVCKEDITVTLEKDAVPQPHSDTIASIGIASAGMEDISINPPISDNVATTGTKDVGSYIIGVCEEDIAAAVEKDATPQWQSDTIVSIDIATAGMEDSLVNPAISDNVAANGAKDVGSDLFGICEEDIAVTLEEDATPQRQSDTIVSIDIAAAIEEDATPQRQSDKDTVVSV